MRLLTIDLFGFDAQNALKFYCFQFLNTFLRKLVAFWLKAELSLLSTFIIIFEKTLRKRLGIRILVDEPAFGTNRQG